MTGKNGKYNDSKAVHVYSPFFDITCSAKNYKIAPALTVLECELAQLNSRLDDGVVDGPEFFLLR
ncbi:MAG: hypothetical protein J1E06_01230, partial [Acutalibacter sp.]|nr:hypothetical protein [Acutalibacter sp.]